MATEEALRTLSFPANTDLSTKQYYFVDLNSSGNVAVAAAGGSAIGVLQNKPDAAGRSATVATEGRTKMVFGASTAIGLRVASDGSGKAVAVASGEMGLGYVVENAGGDGLIGSIVLSATASIG